MMNKKYFNNINILLFLQVLFFSVFSLSSVWASVPELSDSINSAGSPVNAVFYGGASANGGLSFKETFSHSELIDVYSGIDVQAHHIGNQGAVYMVAVVNNAGFYIKTSDDHWVAWDGDLSGLSAAVGNIQFQASETFTVISNFRGEALGSDNSFIDIYIGYSVDSEADEIYFHNQPIHINVVARQEVIVTADEDGSYLCRPVGEPPFPGVLYNHGGLGTSVGGDLEGACLVVNAVN